MTVYTVKGAFSPFMPFERQQPLVPVCLPADGFRQAIKARAVFFQLLPAILGFLLTPPCRHSGQDGSQGPVPGVRLAAGGPGAWPVGPGVRDGWNHLDVSPSCIIVPPGPFIGPGMPPRQGDSSFVGFARIPSPLFLRSKPRPPFT